MYQAGHDGVSIAATSVVLDFNQFSAVKIAACAETPVELVKLWDRFRQKYGRK